jgi:hypothetical protein
MATQRAFKRRVRARMAKTGESYTSARSQLIRKAADSGAVSAPGGAPEPDVPEAIEGLSTVAEPPADGAGLVEPALLPTSEASLLRSTGRSWAAWFALLDAWGGTERNHTETAAWLVAEHGVAGWWAQSITIGYERVRGLRGIHQMTSGYSVGANRTVTVDADRLLDAFGEVGRRSGWLPAAPVVTRRTAAALILRFDWTDPPSRVQVSVAPRGPDKATVSVQHERLPDAAAGERLKGFWRSELGALKAWLEDQDWEVPGSSRGADGTESGGGR